jgi:hypothetical protein
MTRRNVSLKTTLVALCFLMALYQLAGCSGGGGSSVPIGGATTGTLKLAITDKPSDNYGQVVVAVREVRVVPAGLDGAADNDARLPVVVHFNTPQVIDVMQLQFAQQVLGEIVLPAGSYSQIRLILEPNPNGHGQTPLNYLTLKSDPSTKIPMNTPSAQQSGLKILGPLEVKPGVINAVTIDFDPNTAVVAMGNGSYNLKPTGIRMVQLANDMMQFGTIGGNVSATFKDWSSATVSIKRRGAINDSAPIAMGRIFSSYTSGRWQAPFTAFVPSSTQTVSYKTFISANGFRIYSSPAVSVTQGQLTDIGEVPLIPLQ